MVSSSPANQPLEVEKRVNDLRPLGADGFALQHVHPRVELARRLIGGRSRLDVYRMPRTAAHGDECALRIIELAAAAGRMPIGWRMVERDVAGLASARAATTVIILVL